MNPMNFSLLVDRLRPEDYYAMALENMCNKSAPRVNYSSWQVKENYEPTQQNNSQTTSEDNTTEDKTSQTTTNSQTTNSQTTNSHTSVNSAQSTQETNTTSTASNTSSATIETKPTEDKPTEEDKPKEQTKPSEDKSKEEDKNKETTSWFNVNVYVLDVVLIVITCIMLIFMFYTMMSQRKTNKLLERMVNNCSMCSKPN